MYNNAIASNSAIQIFNTYKGSIQKQINDFLDSRPGNTRLLDIKPLNDADVMVVYETIKNIEYNIDIPNYKEV